MSTETHIDIAPAELVNVPAASAGVVPVVSDYSGAASDAALVELWLAGRPGTTRGAYGRDARRLLAFLAARGQSLRTATLAGVQGFVESLTGSDRSRARYVSSAKSLLSFAARTGYSAFNVGAALRLPKLKNELAERILTEEQVFALFQAAKPGRNRTLLRFLYKSGARVSEAISVECQHVQPREQGLAQVTLHGKGGKTRHVLLTADIGAELAELCAGASQWIFRTRRGTRLRGRDAHRIVARAARAAGLEQAVSPHWLRHAHASHALDRGCPIHLVQSDLGHASVSTTGRYLHARPGDGSARYLGV